MGIQERRQHLQTRTVPICAPPHRVGGAGLWPRPRSRDPCHYPQATQPPLVRRNPSAPSNARSRPAGRSVGPEPRETDQREVAAGRWQGSFRSHRRAEATAGIAQAGVCGEACRADGRGTASAQPRLVGDGAVKGRAPDTPTSTSRDRDRLPQERGQPGREMCRRGLGAGNSRLNAYFQDLTLSRPPARADGRGTASAQLAGAVKGRAPDTPTSIRRAPDNPPKRNGGRCAAEDLGRWISGRFYLLRLPPSP
jgi:hypothetical protein